eukprot:TRINITY_DN15656_c0_g1_i1.p1 TRINITY_DN15656_c0_g1~~TRINITY_DN15656_c0_g1_i1.p1  ORF type:complete len:458 (+),score=159.20 TRINITY_DN15656_c0_g1_i1:93-1376(+)
MPSLRALAAVLLAAAVTVSWVVVNGWGPPPPGGAAAAEEEEPSPSALSQAASQQQRWQGAEDAEPPSAAPSAPAEPSPTALPAPAPPQGAAEAPVHAPAEAMPPLQAADSCTPHVVSDLWNASLSHHNFSVIHLKPPCLSPKTNCKGLFQKPDRFLVLCHGEVGPVVRYFQGRKMLGVLERRRVPLAPPRTCTQLRSLERAVLRAERVGPPAPRVAVLGDSIAQGEGLRRQTPNMVPLNGTKVKRSFAYLALAHFGAGGERSVICRAGRSVRDLLQHTKERDRGWEDALGGLRPDVVVIHLGLNDFLVQQSTTGEFARNYRALLRAVRGAAGPTVRLVLCTLTVSLEPWCQKPRVCALGDVERANEFICSLAAAEGHALADFSAVTRPCFESLYYHLDWTHPQLRFQYLLAGALIEALRPLLAPATH